MSGPDTYDGLAEAKRLIRSVRAGALSTLTPDGDPFTTLTTVATMPDGDPILLVSKLAAHTGHLERDGRCSILLAETGRGDPLAYPRLTLVGTAAPAAGRTETAARRFLARNPKAKLYAGFPDFAFWIVAMRSAHLNGGFARAAAFDGAEVATPVEGCGDLIEGEAGAIDHMNADHGSAVAAYATGLAGLPEGLWHISGIDPEGMDLIWGDRTGRIAFPAPVRGPGDLRRCLVELAAKAREATLSGG